MEELKLINPEIRVIGKYTKAVNRLQVQCCNCSKIWEPKAYSLLQGKGCPSCSAKRGARINEGITGLKTREEFIRQLASVNSNINVYGDYENTHSYIKCQCRICGTKWDAKPYSLLQGHGCPRCSKSGTSFMEQYIYHAFVKAYGADSVLSRNRSLIGKELDIFIPKRQLAIEPGNWNLHKKNLKRDAEKRQACKEKGVRLITIYDMFPDTQGIPFKEDCYVYPQDLNKADHSIIQDLSRRLLMMSGYKLDEEFPWAEIEQLAYQDARAKSHEDFVKEMKISLPDIIVLGNYVNTNKRIRVKCSVCGFEWNGVPANMIRGDGCRRCGARTAHLGFLKDQDEFEKQVKELNPNITIIGSYTGRHNRIEAKCNICGYEWEPRASSLLRGSTHKGAKTIHKKLNL